MIISDGKIIKCYNGTADTIPANNIVIVKGKRINIASNDDINSTQYPLGYTLASINSGNYGEIALEGTIQNINTTIYGSEGTILYLSTGGAITVTKPTTAIIIGTIIHSDYVTGSIYFKIISAASSSTSSGTVTSVATTGPITGGTITTSGTIGINQANSTTDGYLSSTDWNTFNDKFDNPTGDDTQYIKGDGTLGTLPTGSQNLQEVLDVGNETTTNIKLIDYTSIELDNGSLLRKGTYNFGSFGDVIVSGITDAGTGLISWRDVTGIKWSDLNGTYIKTDVAVTPTGYVYPNLGIHTPEPGTFNYYLQLLGNPGLNGIAYFLAPGNKSGWGADPDDDANTDPSATYWRLCVLSDWPITYFTNPSTDPYIFPTTGWVPVDDTIPANEGGEGYDYIDTYDRGFTVNLSNVLNGSGGISRICSIGYEDMWQAGIRYVFGNSGTIREATNCFNYIPDSTFDVNKRFAVGSRWILDDGTVYICTDATPNAAIWELQVTSGLPAGGTQGQILTKQSATDGDATWIDNYADWTSVVKHVVKNDGTAVIPKGTPVYVTGANGTNILVRAASNATEAMSSKTMGITASQLELTGGNQTGFIVTEGLLGGLNTNAANVNDPIWLGVNGQMIYGLANKPYGTAHLVFLGIVTKKSSGSGEIFVKIQNGFEIEELHRVSARNPNNNDTLRYNSSTNLWEAGPVIVPAGMTWMGAFPG